LVQRYRSGKLLQFIARDTRKGGALYEAIAVRGGAYEPVETLSKRRAALLRHAIKATIRFKGEPDLTAGRGIDAECDVPNQRAKWQLRTSGSGQSFSLVH